MNHLIYECNKLMIGALNLKYVFYFNVYEIHIKMIINDLRIS
jgi:hypothetical protein